MQGPAMQFAKPQHGEHMTEGKQKMGTGNIPSLCLKAPSYAPTPPNHTQNIVSPSPRRQPKEPPQ